MKFKTIAVAVATVALSFAAAGTAGAQPLGHLSRHHSSSPPQVSGSRLLSGLLAPSAFGDGFYFGASLETGHKLLSTHVKSSVSSLSCVGFEGGEPVSDFGNTAGAAEEFINPSPLAALSAVPAYGFENVLQFATTSSANTYFSQAEAKYAACKFFTEPNPGDNKPGGGTYQVNLLTVSKTSVSGDRGWEATQSIAESERPGVTLYINVLYVIADQDVYSLWDVEGSADTFSSGLMINLVHRVQALYR